MKRRTIKTEDEKACRVIKSSQKSNAWLGRFHLFSLEFVGAREKVSFVLEASKLSFLTISFQMYVAYKLRLRCSIFW